MASDEFLSGAHDLVSWDRNWQTWHGRSMPCLPVAVGGHQVRRAVECSRGTPLPRFVPTAVSSSSVPLAYADEAR